jgi:hypothetical protein
MVIDLDNLKQINDTHGHAARSRANASAFGRTSMSEVLQTVQRLTEQRAMIDMCSASSWQAAVFLTSKPAARSLWNSSWPSWPRPKPRRAQGLHGEREQSATPELLQTLGCSV